MSTAFALGICSALIKYHSKKFRMLGDGTPRYAIVIDEMYITRKHKGGPGGGPREARGIQTRNHKVLVPGGVEVD
jgi:hypothetical protein